MQNDDQRQMLTS